jgi:D-serine deaminase-like pyridoxal phosphate-dependent protein
MRPERIVVGGTPSFREDLHELVGRHRVDAEVEVSPGTWIYWDGDSESRIPGLFEFAALIFAQVIDRPTPDLATLNVGSKRWGVDRGPLEIFSLPGLEVRSVNEEHTVLSVPRGTKVEIGDTILAAPQHVCTTVNLWESFTLLGEDGRVECPSEPVTARNR